MKQEKMPKHGEMFRVRVDHMEPNDWNPNEMSPEEFDALGSNIDNVDFLDPVLVTALGRNPDGTIQYRIIDGEHRWTHARLEDMVDLPVIFADPDKVSVSEQKKQTVKMNVLHGSPNKRKLLALVEDVMAAEDKTMEDVAKEMGFLDYDAFVKMIDDVRESLPSDEMKAEFDKSKDELKTVDDLSGLLNKLFTRYGDTLPANFMILDFGSKKHVWVRMNPKTHKTIEGLARDCMEEGVTFDSVVLRALMQVDSVAMFAQEHGDFLDKIEVDETTIDGLMGDDEDAGS